MSTTDKSSTHQHTVQGKPTTNTGVHSHGLTAVDARLAALEAQMANVILTITKLTDGPPLPPPVPPPIEPTPGTGTVRYISPTGNDSADGLIATPWRTIRKFVSVAKAGDTLYCRGGTYLNPPSTSPGRDGYGEPSLVGTAAAPITIRNYPGETPLFTGPSTSVAYYFILLSGSCSYVTIDGLHFANRSCGDSGYVNIGAWTTDTLVTNITIRNCRFELLAGLAKTSHCVYPGLRGARYLTIEDNVFIGPNDGTGGAGFHVWLTDAVGVRDITVRRNIFDGFTGGGGGVAGCLLWHQNASPNLTADISHNTFVDCISNVYIREHAAVTVRDNAGTPATAGASYNIYDPNDSAETTADHNVWDATFTADYHLAVGSSGHDAASDGTDCGALDN